MTPTVCLVYPRLSGALWPRAHRALLRLRHPSCLPVRTTRVCKAGHGGRLRGHGGQDGRLLSRAAGALLSRTASTALCTKGNSTPPPPPVGTGALWGQQPDSGTSHRSPVQCRLRGSSPSVAVKDSHCLRPRRKGLPSCLGGQESALLTEGLGGGLKPGRRRSEKRQGCGS